MIDNSNKNSDRNEIIELIKLFHNDYIYRHTNYWSVVYKSMISILGLLSLPYFIYNKVNYQILTLFPFVSFILCFFSLILLESEAARMDLSKTKMNDLLNTLSNNYPENQLNETTFVSRILKIKITKKILLLYLFLIIISVVEFVLILTDKFF